MSAQSGNIVACDDCHNYDLAFVKNLQKQVNSNMSYRINTKRVSDKNDLAKCFNQEIYWKLNIYNNILTEVSYCDSCFEGYDIQTITGLVKNSINAK